MPSRKLTKPNWRTLFLARSRQILAFAKLWYCRKMDSSIGTVTSAPRSPTKSRKSFSAHSAS
eukprot:3786435-Prorocentrum_lima.AAC.1